MVRMNAKSGSMNRKEKGSFQMEFNTLSDIADLWAGLFLSGFWYLRFADLKSELTNKEFKICLAKVNSLIKKRRKNYTPL